MDDRSYMTIDPLIMETLHLNERRIYHIFDILHGKDPAPYTERATNKTSKLPRIVEQQQRIENPRQIPIVPKKRAASTSIMHSPRKSLTFDAKDVHEESSSAVNHPISEEKEHSRVVAAKKSPINHINKNIKTIDVRRRSPTTDKSKQVVHDYGQGNLRRNKSL